MFPLRQMRSGKQFYPRFMSRYNNKESCSNLPLFKRHKYYFKNYLFTALKVTLLCSLLLAG